MEIRLDSDILYLNGERISEVDYFSKSSEYIEIYCISDVDILVSFLTGNVYIRQRSDVKIYTLDQVSTSVPEYGDRSISFEKICDALHDEIYHTDGMNLSILPEVPKSPLKRDVSYKYLGKMIANMCQIEPPIPDLMMSFILLNYGASGIEYLYVRYT